MSFLGNIWNGIQLVVSSPFHDLNTLWVLGPILLLWITLIVYFDIYKNEKLGWNTALANGISMFWISIMLMRHLFSEGFEWTVFITLGFVITYSVFIVVISFKHSMEESIAFKLASPTPTYYVSGAAVVVGYGALEVNLYTILGLIIVFGAVLGLNSFVSIFIPDAARKTQAKGKDPRHMPVQMQRRFRPVPARHPMDAQRMQQGRPRRPMNLEDVRI